MVNPRPIVDADGASAAGRGFSALPLAKSIHGQVVMFDPQSARIGFCRPYKSRKNGN